jgi:CPA1 family monovalent cation:H+ antiporter
MSLLLVISVLFVLTAFFGVVNERYLRLQPSIGLMLLALVMSLVFLGLKSAGIVAELGSEDTILRELNFSSLLLNGVLCFMLFAGSAGVEFKSLEKDKWVILSLAIGATLIACALTGALLHLVLGWLGVTLALSYALVFGALISPTDPIAALAILKAAGLPPRLEAIINGESLFNDGVGVVLFTVALAYAQGSAQEGSPLALFLREVLGGVGLGLAVGLALHLMLMRTKDYTNQLLATLGGVALGYSIALQIDVSGPIAMVVAGLVAGNVSAPPNVLERNRRGVEFAALRHDRLDGGSSAQPALRAARRHQAPDLGRATRRLGPGPRPFASRKPRQAPDRQHDVRRRRLLGPCPRIDDRKVLQALLPARASQVGKADRV